VGLENVRLQQSSAKSRDQSAWRFLGRFGHFVVFWDSVLGLLCWQVVLGQGENFQRDLLRKAKSGTVTGLDRYPFKLKNLINGDGNWLGSHRQQRPHRMESGWSLCLPLCSRSSAFTKRSTADRVCLRSWGHFQRLTEITPKWFFVYRFPKSNLDNPEKQAELTLPQRQVIGWMPSQKSLLAQCSNRIWLKSYLWGDKRRWRGGRSLCPLLRSQQEKGHQRNWSRCFFTLEFYTSWKSRRKHSWAVTHII